MSAITAAVVGVIMNLAIWFSLHVLFREAASWESFGMRIDLPVLSAVNLPSLAPTLAALFAFFRLKMTTLAVLLAAALTGTAVILLSGSG